MEAVIRYSLCVNWPRNAFNINVDGVIKIYYVNVWNFQGIYEIWKQKQINAIGWLI